MTIQVILFLKVWISTNGTFCIRAEELVNFN